jgi:hypothetical protein
MYELSGIVPSHWTLRGTIEEDFGYGLAIEERKEVEEPDRLLGGGRRERTGFEFSAAQFSRDLIIHYLSMTSVLMLLQSVTIPLQKRRSVTGVSRPLIAIGNKPNWPNFVLRSASARGVW